MSVVVRACICLAFALPTLSTLAQAQKQLPISVQKELAEMMKICKDTGGKPSKSPGLLIVADLTGDGLPDFVIDQAAFNCDGALSLFTGSGGSQVLVYVGTPDGQANQAFAGGTFGVKVDKESKPARLKIIVGGPLCGQKVTPQTPRANYKSCWRPVQWNASTKKLDYAPLSQIEPVQ